MKLCGFFVRALSVLNLWGWLARVWESTLVRSRDSAITATCTFITFNKRASPGCIRWFSRPHKLNLVSIWVTLALLRQSSHGNLAARCCTPSSWSQFLCKYESHMGEACTNTKHTIEMYTVSLRVTGQLWRLRLRKPSVLLALEATRLTCVGQESSCEDNPKVFGPWDIL